MLARVVAALLVDIRCTIHEMETNYVHSEEEGAKSLVDHTYLRWRAMWRDDWTKGTGRKRPCHVFVELLNIRLIKN
jgi:hypothetical protein